MKSSTASRNFRPFHVLTLFGSGLLSAPAAATLSQIQGADMSVLFDTSATPERQARLMNLKDLNLSDADLNAIVVHSRRRLKIQREVDILGAEAIDDRADEDINVRNNPMHQKCIEDLNNWKVSAVRIAPFEYSLPGSKTVLNDFAKARKATGLDRVFEVRYTLNPFCEEIDEDDGSKRMRVVDVGLHVIFHVWPTDVGLRDSLLIPLKDFLQKNERLKFSEAQADLEKHLAALNSPAYQAFYLQLMNELGTLAASRASIPAATPAVAKLYQDAAISPLMFLSTLNEEGDHLELPPIEERHSAPLKWTGPAAFANEDYFTALKKFTAMAARRENLERVAINFLEGGDSWTLAGLTAVTAFRAGVFAKDSNEAAKAVYQKLFPQELSTFQAVRGTKNELSIRKVSNSNYYADLALQSQQDIKKKIRGVEILDVKLFGRSDFFSSGTDGSFLRPKPSSSDKIPLSRLLNSPEKINATATSCTTCHVMPVMTGSGDARKGFSEDIDSITSLEPQAEVRMMGFSAAQAAPVLRSMTVNEIALDKKKLEAFRKSVDQ